MNKSIVIIFILLVVIQAGKVKNTTDFYQKKLGSKLYYQTYSGFEEINWYRPVGQSGMFYQLFGKVDQSLSKPNPEIPLFLWLNGGPGSSSQYGAMCQLGPLRIVNGTVKQNHFGWNYMGHLLFIDSPLNVGFSYFGNRTGPGQVGTSSQTADHLINFLANFYKTWPQLLQSPLYISGESYAGHYVSVLARKILTNNTAKGLVGKIQGVIIGDGWIDPINQMNNYDSYVWSVGIADKGFRNICRWFQSNGIVNIYNKDYVKATNYWDFLTNNGTTFDYYLGGISEFNFRKYNGEGDDYSFESFLETNKKQFGADDVQYISGNGDVYKAFQEDISKTVAPDLVQVLKRVKVLIYNGQQDYVINTPGVLQYLNSLGWNNINGWKRSPKIVWRVSNQVRGWAKTYNNLWFVLINKAGHMSPLDQPQSTYTMIYNFLTNSNNWDH